MLAAMTNIAPTLSDDERALLRPIDGQRDLILANVLDWSAINSGSRNLDGLARMADMLSAAMAPLGGMLRRLPAAPATQVAANGAILPLQHGENLHLCLRPDVDRRVVLVGHMDTVFPADHAFQTCRWLDDTIVNGPGVADMKGGIAVMLAAIAAFEASPFADRLGIDVVIVADEEVSSLGSAPLLAAVAARCQTGLCYEPSALPDGTLAGARKGSGNFSLIVSGRSAHAGRNPDEGRNAIVAAAELAMTIASLHGARDGLTTNVARIDGGSANNVVPDTAVVRFNVRVKAADDQPWVRDQIEAAMASVAARRDVGVALHGEFYRPPKPMDDRQQALFDMARRCGVDLGIDIRWQDSGGVCDGNNLAALGLAVIDTLGVRGGAIHSPDEYMAADSLEERAKLSALLLARLAAKT